MTIVHNEWCLGYEYQPQNLSKEACYRFEILVKYKRLRKKGFNERGALKFLDVKRSTFFIGKKNTKANVEHKK